MMIGDEHKEVDKSEVSNCHAPLSKGLDPKPVFGGSSGEGLPYAPEDWPNPGDKWRWKVGRDRKSKNGHWLDRYLYPPSSCQKSTGRQLEFASKRSLEEYFRKEFPNADFEAFLSSFIWRVPCSSDTPRKEAEKKNYSFKSRRKIEINDRPGSESAIRDGDCKARNRKCSLNINARSSRLAAKACDICCSEDGFCRDCSCILCCRSIDSDYEGYSFIRCETKLDDKYICGHVAHIDCALRCYMAGTVGGSIDLDVQYYCRRCDNKTDLISHVTKIIKTCESLDSEDDIRKILTLGLCLVRGSEKATARNLRNYIELLMPKVKGGVHPVEIGKVEDKMPASNAGRKIQGRSSSIASDFQIQASPSTRLLSSAMTRGDKHKEVDMSEVSICNASCSKGLDPKPVAGGSSGEGLPYAPEDWPNPGDKWRWKVGRDRKSKDGHWTDRYLYPPSSYQKSTGRQLEFASKRSLEEYIRKEFPNADFEAFLSSFIWRVPCSSDTATKEAEKKNYSCKSRRKVEMNERPGSESAIRDGDCKARNRKCSLNINARSSRLAAKACDICCSEDGFCRDCSCILCCRSIDWDYEGYSFIRCETKLDDKYICGHVAHIDCALRCYMAGTVGGSIDLDVQYYCRRCDNKTDLISHVNKIIKTCQSVDSEDDIRKILTLGLCLLRGSEKATARNLQNQIELLMPKIKGGVRPVEIGKVEDKMPASNAGEESHYSMQKSGVVIPTSVKRQTQGPAPKDHNSS